MIKTDICGLCYSNTGVCLFLYFTRISQCCEKKMDNTLLTN